MLRWDYAGVEKIISNGQLVWVFDPDLMQATETMVDPLSPGISTDFLTGIGNIDTDFEIKLLKEDASGFTLSLIPRGYMGNTEELIVEIDRTYLLKKTIAIDNFKNETRVEFHAISVNAPIQDTHFEYVAGPGVSIIRP
jgi:outer membrane lipoprotein carrier protein